MPQVGNSKPEVPRTGRVQNDEEPKNNIKLDYSETYHENDQLDFLLENKLTDLHKAKFRSGLEREASFKVARKAAENIQSLSEAIRRGSIPSSVTLYKQDPGRRRSSGVRQGTNVETITESMKGLTTAKNDCEQKQRVEITTVDTVDAPPKPKPAGNTLTMFALSLHKFHNNIGIGRSSESAPQIMKKRSYSAKSLPNASKSRNMSRFRSARYARQHLKNGAALDVIESVPATNYGSDDYKKKTKSRRQLQELSKLEQANTFDTPNKPEDRRRRLYEWAKGDPKALDGRIQSFISDVEDFKRRNTHPDIKIDPSLFSNSPSYAY